MRFLRGLVPNPSMVVAVLVLVLVSGGSAVAGALITSADIKNRTIKMQDVSKKTVNQLKSVRGWAFISPAVEIMYEEGTFENLAVTHLATGVYCLDGDNNGLGNYDPVLATAHGQDFAKLVVTVNTEYGSQCNPYGGRGVFVTDLAGTPKDAYFVITLL